MTRMSTLAGSALLLSITWSPSSQAEEGDIEQLVRQQGEQIRRLEEELERLKEAPSDDRNHLEKEVDTYLAESQRTQVEYFRQRGGGARRVRLGGYFALEFRDDGDGATMEFDQHRLVLKLNADIAPGLTFDMELEIEGGGADVGFLEDNEILLEYAELSYELIEDNLIFKVGALLVPWGRFNLYHDDPYQDLTDRPLVARRIAVTAFDQPGVGVEGTFDLGGHWFLDYDVALTQGLSDNITTNGGLCSARQSFRSDNNENKHLWSRVVVSAPVRMVDILEIGGSANTGKHDDLGHHRNYGYGLDLFVKRGPFELIGEYMNQRIERDPSAPISDPRRQSGWYVDLNYHFFPDAWRGAHKLLTAESTFTVVLRFEAIDLNHTTSGSTFRDDLQQITFGLNFRPVERNVFKVSYTWVDSEIDGFESGSSDRFVMSWASYF